MAAPSISKPGAWLGYVPGFLLGFALTWSWAQWGDGITTAFYRPIAAITVAAMLIAWLLAKPFGLSKSAALGVALGTLAVVLALLSVIFFI